MERQATASSSTFFIELAVIAAVLFYLSVPVHGTTDPNDGTDLRAFLYFFCCLLACFLFPLLLLLLA